MDMLGLGMKVDLQEDVTRKVDPIIRELERLKRSMKDTETSMNGMYRTIGQGTETYMRAERVREMANAHKGLDQTLNSATESLVRATISQDNFNRSMDAFSTQHIQRTMSEMTRAQRQLSMFGFGMSQLQKEMANQKGYMAMRYQLQEIEDRAKMTERALKEMLASPNADKYAREIDLARKALAAYKSEAMSVRDAQAKLARDMGMGYTRVAGRPAMYQKPQSFTESMGRRAFSGMFLDVGAVAGNIGKYYDDLAKKIVGVGYSAMEARQKTAQLGMTLMTVGMMMSTTVSLGVLMATAALGTFIAKFQEANNLMQSRTLAPQTAMYQQGGWSDDMNAVWQEMGRGVSKNDVAETMSYVKNTYSSDPKVVSSMTRSGLQFKKSWGVESKDAIETTSAIAEKYGVSYASALDMLTVALMETDGSLEDVNGKMKENAGWLPRLAGDTDKLSTAFERMSAATEQGVAESFTRSLKSMGTFIQTMYENSGADAPLSGFFNGIGTGFNAVSGFLDKYPLVAKLGAGLVAVAGSVLLLAGPLALVTSLGIRYRDMLFGIQQALSIGFTKGGVAMLAPQAQRGALAVRGLVQAFANLPGLLLRLPLLLYGATRMLGMFLLQVALANPMLVVGGLAIAAYMNNWGGFRDDLKGTIGVVKDAWKNVKMLGELGEGNFLQATHRPLTTLERVLKGAYTGMQLFSAVWENMMDGNGDMILSAEQYEMFKNLGMTDLALNVQKTYKAVTDFFDGFADGFEQVYDVAKNFLKDVLEPFGDQVEWVLDKLGLSGGSYTEGNLFGVDWTNVGNVIGTVVASLLAFKAMSWLATPFVKLYGSAKKGLGVVSSLSSRLKGLRSRDVTVRVREVHTGGDLDLDGGRRSRVDGGGGGRGPTRAQRRQAAFDARYGGYVGYLGGLDGADMSRRNRQGRAARADTSTRRGRRAVRRGYRSARIADAWNRLTGTGTERQARTGRTRTGERLTRREGRYAARREGTRAMGGNWAAQGQRAGQAFDRAFNASTRNVGSRLGNGVSRAGNRIAQAGNRSGRSFVQRFGIQMNRLGQRVNQSASRMNTSAFSRRGQTAGRGFGNAFGRASRTGMSAGRLFGNVSRGAGRAGRGVGRGLTRGLGTVVRRGLPMVFKLGLRAIPFLGWALMAWDIISAIFTNWDAIKSAAKKAWKWIKTDGKEMAIAVYDSIKEKLGKAWDWVQKQAGKASEAAGKFFSKLGEDIVTWISEAAATAWDKFVELAGKGFLGIPGLFLAMTVKLISNADGSGKSVGAALKDGIVSMVQSAVDSAASLISSIPGKIAGIGGGIMKGVRAVVPGLSKGGIVNSPTLSVTGESGPEAVIPLSGNMRGRAHTLLKQAGAVLGYDVSPNGDAPRISHSQSFHREAHNSRSPLKMFARGGFVSRPTAGVIGEDGEEVAIPTSGRHRDRARQLAKQVNKRLGMESGGSATNVDASVRIDKVEIHVSAAAGTDPGKQAEEVLRQLRKKLQGERRKRGRGLTLEDLVLNINT